jgi:hypothetical protein
MLHVNKLEEFEQFLEVKGYMILPTVGAYEVLRARKGKDTVIVYRQREVKEHLSIMDKDYRLVREFMEVRNNG